MVDKKDFTSQEYESIIEELIKENEELKKRIAKLEHKDQAYKEQKKEIIETPKTIGETKPPTIESQPSIIEAETIEPIILTEELINEEEGEPITQEKEAVISKSIFSESVSPLQISKGEVLQGDSRRECPKCGNNNKVLIRETIDKDHLICDYPRMYGKKYHCGECGVEWRVPLEM